MSERVVSPESKSIHCWIRSCKWNKEGCCRKYSNAEEVKLDFERGGGCAFTWFFSGRVPK